MRRGAGTHEVRHGSKEAPAHERRGTAARRWCGRHRECSAAREIEEIAVDSDGFFAVVVENKRLSEEKRRERGARVFTQHKHQRQGRPQ